ncbi:ABC transporter ATP-binding protein [Allorhodopirellula solitaria]|uniref:Putative ABC transporter ATP-binding protein YxlF n=1 Tax=Allorhodopirellula solitaria TaxID=2527987 RepID=A0A5C5YHT8_9BACT|nr:ABC transporter ATP-binding protein [Allorhodopirellula solitaria]TWT73262.1 putative ABC transporter ATP-binding protein YxlF [Allorhodopirellula solitaria]
MNNDIIRTSGLRKHFGKNEVLRGVDLAIPRGAVVGLLGSNGAGKSTLIKCLLGLLKISAGTATLMGEDPWNLSAHTKSRIGYVPQVVHLYPWMKVRQVIEYTGAFYANWDHAWCRELLDQWDLDGAAWIRNLSTGQLQRLGLILGMGHRPDLYLLDEPAASLDPSGRRSLLRSLLEITEDREHSILFSTHITSDLERIASHVAIMGNGVIDYFGELDELKDSVKRIRVHSPVDLPPDFSVPGALRTEINGDSAIVAVAAVNDEVIDGIRDRWDASVDVEDLNLEDIFLELHDAQ